MPIACLLRHFFGYLGGMNAKLQSLWYESLIEHGGEFMRLGKEEGDLQNQFAVFLGKDKSTMPGLIDGMKKPLVFVRLLFSGDSRIKIIYWTNKRKVVGQDALNFIKETHTESSKDVTSTRVKITEKVLKNRFENLEKCNNSI